MRRTFVIGKIDRKTTEIRLVEKVEAPISGPFSVAAVVRPTRQVAQPQG